MGIWTEQQNIHVFEGDLRLATESHPFPLWQSRWQSKIPYKWAFKWIYSVYYAILIIYLVFHQAMFDFQGVQDKTMRNSGECTESVYCELPEMGFIRRQMGLNGKTFMFTLMLLWISRAQNSPLGSSTAWLQRL